MAAADGSLGEALAVVGGVTVARADGQITTVAISPDNHWVVMRSRHFPQYKTGDYEVDHWISLSLGGSNSIRNL